MDNLEGLQVNESDEPQPLDEDEKAILKFVTQNPGKTEFKIATQMNIEGECARATTGKKLWNLVKRGFVEARKEKANSFYRFFPSNKNQFTVIYNELLKIRNIIDSMFETVRKIRRRTDSFDLDDHFVNPYLQVVSSMLRILLLRTFLTTFSEVDSQTLYAIIIKLMLKLDFQPYNLERAANSLTEGRRALHTTIRGLSREKASKRSLLDIHVLNDLQREIQFFEKDVLPWFDYLKS